MAGTYGIVAVLVVLIAFYALGRKKKGSYPQARKASIDATEKEELKTVKSPVTDVSRVSIAADIISARTEAAEMAQQAAARAAEQTSSSQPLTPVGARVSDKMEVAEVVASKRKSRPLSLDFGGSKVFGGMPTRCKGIRPELGRSGIVLEGFHERRVPERRHSILGILRGEDFEVLPEISQSLPDIKKHRATVDENLARATADVSPSIIDLYDEWAASAKILSEDPSRTSSRQGPQNLPGTSEATQGYSGTSSSSTDFEYPRTNEKVDSTSPEYQTEQKRFADQGTKPQPHGPTDSISKSLRSSIPMPDGTERVQRPSKSKTKQYLQISRRGTLETVRSESILSPESEFETPSSDQQSSGSTRETLRTHGGVVKSPRSSVLHAKSSSTIRPSHSSVDALEETVSTSSTDDRIRAVKLDDKRFSDAMHAVEKLVDKLTAPMVDTIRAAASSKRKIMKGGSPGTTSPVGETTDESTKNQSNRRTMKSRTSKNTDDSQKPTTSDNVTESAEHKPVLPRIWESSTELPGQAGTFVKSSSTSLRATDVSSFETSQPTKEAPDSDTPESPPHRPILPRMWASDVSDAEEKTRESTERGKEKLTEEKSSLQPSKETKDSDSPRKTRRKNIFSPQAWGIKGQKQKSDGKSSDVTNGPITQKSLETTSDERHIDASVLAESKTVSITTSHETMSVRSISEHMSWDSTVPLSTSHGAIARSSTSFRSVRSRTSARLSRYKYTSDVSLKRHGVLKRADGTPILPVSQATLQTIFSQNNAEATILESETNETEQNTKEEKVMNESTLNSKVSSREKPRNYSIHNVESVTEADKQTSMEAIENLISYNTSTTNAPPVSPERSIGARRTRHPVSSSKNNKWKRERKGSKSRPLDGTDRFRSSYTRVTK